MKPKIPDSCYSCPVSPNLKKKCTLYGGRACCANLWEFYFKKEIMDIRKDQRNKTHYSNDDGYNVLCKGKTDNIFPWSNNEGIVTCKQCLAILETRNRIRTCRTELAKQAKKEANKRAIKEV